MTAITTQEHSTEARLLGALAHASIIGQGVGLLVGVLVYINQRDKSKYAAFQALQAAIYQLFSLVVIIGSWIIWTILYTLSFVWMIPMMEANPDAPPPLGFWVAMLSMIIPFAIMSILALYGFIGGWRVWQGRDFRYAVIGNWLEKSGLWNKQNATEDK